MGYEARKTEHSGPKRGNGAYWGYKWEAKRESNRIRRENAKREIRAATIGLRNCPTHSASRPLRVKRWIRCLRTRHNHLLAMPSRVPCRSLSASRWQ
jgi:hypothetical protein